MKVCHLRGRTPRNVYAWVTAIARLGANSRLALFMQINDLRNVPGRDRIEAGATRCRFEVERAKVHKFISDQDNVEGAQARRTNWYFLTTIKPTQVVKLYYASWRVLQG